MPYGFKFRLLLSLNCFTPLRIRQCDQQTAQNVEVSTLALRNTVIAMHAMRRICGKIGQNIQNLPMNKGVRLIAVPLLTYFKKGRFF